MLMDHYRKLRLSVVILVVVGALLPTTIAEAGEPNRVFEHVPVPRLKSGVVIGRESEAGYSNLVTVVLPRLASGAIDSLPSYAQQYASKFKFTVLANVTSRDDGSGKSFYLDKVGIGFSMEIGKDLVVVSKETANDFGANLGMIDRTVLGGNEECLDDIIQVARTNRLIVYDAEATMLIGEKHEKRIIRHLLWVSPRTGQLGSLVWQLKAQGSGDYLLDSPDMQLLPMGYKEDRRIHVSEGGMFSSVAPSPDQFAMVSLPPGKPVPFNTKLRAVAARRKMSVQELQQLVDGVAEAIATIRMSAVR